MGEAGRQEEGPAEGQKGADDPGWGGQASWVDGELGGPGRGGCASPGGALRVVRTSASGSSMLRFVSVGMLAHGKINYHVRVQRSPTGAALIETILKRPTGSKNGVSGEPLASPSRYTAKK